MKNNTSIAMRKQNSPLSYPETVRPDYRALRTSARAGKTYPAGFIPVMPQDALVSGGGMPSVASFQVRMEETAKMLSNAVHFRAHAYFVSLAALTRFDGLESVSYAWAGKAGSAPIVETYAFSAASHGDFYKVFGEHIKEGENINSLYAEAYNKVINYRRQQVSISLAQRLDNDHSLARALWGNTAIARIVPNFDDALIEGEVALNVVGGKAFVRTDGVGPSPSTVERSDTGFIYLNNAVEGQTEGSQLWAEMEENGITVSLAKIEAAKKTQAFAKLRQQFAGNDEELIDLLMRGLEVPNMAYQDPILIGTGTGVFGMTQRYATDAANLDTYVANGGVRVDIPLRLPQQPTGGVIVITYEVIPEPVFDRQADMFLHMDQTEYPNALRDHLDIQPVDVVPNRFVDVLHSSPDGTFGYAPMNYAMARRRVGVGGRFYRTLAVSATAEDQQHIWSVRTVDPVLNEDTFLVPEDLAHNVFLDTVIDPFLVDYTHNVNIKGITQFGPALYESTGDYHAVAAIVPSSTIDPTP